MKTILETVGGYACIGHMAIKANAACIIQSPDNKAKSAKKLVSRKHELSPIDREVSCSEIARATGMTIILGDKIFKPNGNKEKK